MAVATHDEIHIGLDYIDEVARILVDAAMHHDDPDLRLSESRLWFLAHAVEEASGRARAAEPHAKRRGWLKNGNPPGDLSKAKRCGARTRGGKPCRGAAMANGRCRMHGGPSTGSRTPEGKERSHKASWRHGRYSAEAIKRRREARAIIRAIRELIGGG